MACWRKTFSYVKSTDINFNPDGIPKSEDGSQDDHDHDDNVNGEPSVPARLNNLDWVMYQAQPGYPAQPGSAPSALPTASLFDSVAGYEQTTYDQDYFPHPPAAPSMPEQERPNEQFAGAAVIIAKEARNTMLDIMSSQCSYVPSKAAKQMVIHNIKPSSAYHYKLSTFTESRSTSWQVEPYSGQVIDGPHNGLAPGPWDVNVQPSKLFSPSSTCVEVPHTASVKQCHECYGGGYKQCSKCLGRASETCSMCQGSGFKKNELDEENQCTTCRGSGESRCITCNGDGRVQCTTCKSHGKLKAFIQLTVTWKMHDKDYVVERSLRGPKEKVAAANGIQIFHQELPRVWPITTFFDKDINVASKRIVNEHANAWPQERILMQRQVLRAVPIAKVAYGSKEENLRFWVYGNEPRQVFVPDDRQQCCCGCVIL